MALTDFFVLNDETRIFLVVLEIFEYNISNKDKPLDDLGTSNVLQCPVKCETKKFHSAACLLFSCKNCQRKTANFGIMFKYKLFLMEPIPEEDLCNFTDSNLYKSAVLFGNLKFNKFAISMSRINAIKQQFKV